MEAWNGKRQILCDRKLKFVAQNTTNPFFRDEVNNYSKLNQSVNQTFHFDVFGRLLQCFRLRSQIIRPKGEFRIMTVLLPTRKIIILNFGQGKISVLTRPSYLSDFVP